MSAIVLQADASAEVLSKIFVGKRVKVSHVANRQLQVYDCESVCLEVLPGAVGKVTFVLENGSKLGLYPTPDTLTEYSIAGSLCGRDGVRVVDLVS